MKEIHADVHAARRLAGQTITLFAFAERPDQATDHFFPLVARELGDFRDGRLRELEREHALLHHRLASDKVVDARGQMVMDVAAEIEKPLAAILLRHERRDQELDVAVLCRRGDAQSDQLVQQHPRPDVRADDHIRHLSDLEAILFPPKALRPDIKIEHFMKIGPMAVRILYNHSKLYYTTFDGNVFEIMDKDSAQHDAKKIISASDHGITRLQGALFLHDTLFLCGNVDFLDKKSTRGRLVRIVFDTAGKPSSTVVFNTVEYGANKTIYDHGWNALAVSPDGKYIFVNSGARTDHGEVQDNGGLYPNARDNSLTSKIFRFPINATDLLLTDDIAKLKADGYLYAEGIRNAYDMAFDRAGNLFAVVNSADYDNPEDMFWVRQGHHYGFPWIMGGIENPQQYPDWKPDPETDAFINKFSHSWKVNYFRNDTSFPKIPAGLKFSPGVQNWGPDANEYRGHTGKVLDGDQTGVAVSTFTAHSSPLGLFFDTEKQLGNNLQGDGFVIRYSLGKNTALMKPFTDQGSDLLHLRLSYDSTSDNYFTKTVRIVDGFDEPTDDVLVGNILYVIEYGGRSGHIWKITLPAAEQKTTPAKKKLKK